ncbi:MAG TPA: acyl carrier protein [Candidatus Gemmiger faecigallinarum]|nr:acyl carrier protein [Candidatus Gemmiger faecigallinarum]
MHTNEEILSVLAEVKPGLTPAPDEELIKTGLLDSVEVMQLVMALGEEFDVEITPADLREENFHTVACIRALIDRLEEE